MENLGKKEPQLYDNPASPKEKERIRYPSISLPISIVKNEGADLETEVTLTLKGKISALEKNEWRQEVTIEVHEGELEVDNEALINKK